MEQQQPPPPPQQKRQRSPHPPQPRVPCARCGSSDTKFCYYNNYNTAQPRHYCRACKRHWTHGGTLRNVPEGGSSKKTKRRPSSSVSSAVAANVKLPQGHAPSDRTAPAVAAGTGHTDDVARAPPPPPFFYGGAGGVGLFGEEIIGLPGFTPGGVVGDFGRPSPPGFINPIDGVSLQQLVQPPRLSLALHQNLLLLQQQQSWRPPQPNAAAPPFPAITAAPAAATAAVTDEIRNRTNSLFNMSGADPPPPPPSSFM